ncbi:MAG: hypothetical protein IT436_08380 [Phycisphaerales bacterium]|nr:hypothetical protein [Phycisphaerales bacterium]
MGGSTTQSFDFPREGGTVVVLERSTGFRPAHLLDPELPWVVAWRWVRGPRALAAAEPVVPVLTGAPGLARLRAVCAVMVMETRRAIELADELTGGVLAQLDGPPGEAMPDDFPTLPAYQMAMKARTCGVRLTISDEGALVATAFDDAALARLRERYLAVTGERI